MFIYNVKRHSLFDGDNMGAKVLIVEDDNYINNMIKDALEMAGYECIQAFSGTEGLLLLNESP